MLLGFPSFHQIIHAPKNAHLVLIRKKINQEIFSVCNAARDVSLAMGPLPSNAYPVQLTLSFSSLEMLVTTNAFLNLFTTLISKLANVRPYS